MGTSRVRCIKHYVDKGIKLYTNQDSNVHYFPQTDKVVHLFYKCHKFYLMTDILTMSQLLVGFRMINHLYKVQQEGICFEIDYKLRMFRLTQLITHAPQKKAVLFWMRHKRTAACLSLCSSVLLHNKHMKLKHILFIIGVMPEKYIINISKAIAKSNIIQLIKLIICPLTFLYTEAWLALSPCNGLHLLYFYQHHIWLLLLLQ